MVTERVDTNSFKLIPEGTRKLYIEGVKKKEGKNNPAVKYYAWGFQCEIDGATDSYNVLMFKNEMADLLRALGCKEVKTNDFEVDWDAQVNGQWIEATVVHVENNGRVKEQFANIKKIDDDGAWGN